ncbi:fimbrial protein [Escherichia coli]|nr:fimbrial protein [Escherichia coli]
MLKEILKLTALSSCILVPCSYASCSGIMGRTITGYDYDTASIGVGRININSNYLQPVGTILATGISNYNAITQGGLAGLSDESIILTCTTQNDKNNLHWAFATNGDSRIGGFYEIPGNPGYFATQFPYVGIKLSFVDSGEVFSRIWQQSSLTVTTENTSNGGFVIRKKHIPKVIASLVKWSEAYGAKTDSSGNTVGATYCHGAGNETIIPTSQTSNPDQVWSADYYKTANLAAGCGQPSGYINLLGTGGYTVNVGKDSNKDYYAWDYSIPIGLNGSPAATFSYSPGCVVRTATPYVFFPTITVSQLNAGSTISKTFDVSLECDNTISKVISVSSIAVGLQPSESAFSHAKRLGLIDSATGGVTYLLSDDYGSVGVATGVGITLKNADGSNLNFVSWDGCVSTNYGSTSYCPAFASLAAERAAGWDPVLSASTETANDTTNATITYRKSYTATLVKLPNITPTIGKVKATATVLVRYP